MNETIIKSGNDFYVKRTEKCIQCEKDTGVPINQHVDLRETYVEGAGQLCKDCYDKTYNKTLLFS